MIKLIIRVFDEERANICDNLLTKLIQDERQYDNSIDDSFVVKDYFKNVIKNKNNILLCYEEDTIIKGYIFFKIINTNNNNGYLIDGLYVIEEYRNNGIATKLLESGLNILNDTNVKFIDINVLSNNKSAINLYKKFGFNEFKISFRKDL
ncbi:MAG: GNAT family N-acetyltransferase [Firmicutes bacterium]|nr:GNAT family N-acetyltransferase [Bacillota bacterium]